MAYLSQISGIKKAPEGALRGYIRGLYQLWRLDIEHLVHHLLDGVTLLHAEFGVLIYDPRYSPAHQDVSRQVWRDHGRGAHQKRLTELL